MSLRKAVLALPVLLGACSPTDYIALGQMVVGGIIAPELAAGGLAAVGGVVTGAQPVSMSMPIQPDPRRSCRSFREELEQRVIANAGRPEGAPIRPFPIHQADVDRCGLMTEQATLRRRYPRAFN